MLIRGQNSSLRFSVACHLSRRAVGCLWPDAYALMVLMKPLSLMLAVLFTAALACGQNTGTPIDSHHLVQPADLARTLQSGEKPVILYVGPHTLYAQAHLPGAEDMGPSAKSEGMDKLRSRVKSLPRDAMVVIYCGCCPWDHCPNIRPAYHELAKMGFTKVRVLYLATSLGSDWADKGYPVAKGD